VEPRCLEHNVSIVRCIPNDLPKINIDKIKLENAIMNFVSNALDAMPKGGELKVEAQKDKFQQELIIRISDTGVGISPDDLDKILEPFYTTKEYGTGLGLGMAYQTIRAHQGTIKIDSSLGNGTTIEVKLPFSRN
jgi:two-component system sensor histidine kinase AtoS